MFFYLGTHIPEWLSSSPVPLFISRRRLAPIKSLPQAALPWALDSGGFTELALHGGWTISASQYAAEVSRFAAEIGQLDFAAPQDWMCEPGMLNDRTVREHQVLTTNNYLELRQIDPTLPFIPVLQGWAIDDYLRHMDDYAAAGVDLASEPRVGVGSVCRRQNTAQIDALFERLRSEGLRLHAFGVKTQGLGRYSNLLASADSLAWSFAASRDAPLEGHDARHASCSNCMDYALRWRGKALERAAHGRQRLGISSVTPSEELMTYPAADARVSGAIAVRSTPKRPTRTPAIAQRRLTPVWSEATNSESSDPEIWPVFTVADGRYVGEIVRTSSGRFRPVLKRFPRQDFQSFPSLKEAGRAAGWNVDAQQTVISNRFDSTDVRPATAFVHLDDGKIRFGLYDTESNVVSHRLFATERLAQQAFAREGRSVFVAPDGAPAVKGQTTATIYVDNGEGFWFTSRATSSQITGGRWAGDIEIDGATPVPPFVSEAREGSRDLVLFP